MAPAVSSDPGRKRKGKDERVLTVVAAARVVRDLTHIWRNDRRELGARDHAIAGIPGFVPWQRIKPAQYNAKHGGETQAQTTEVDALNSTLYYTQIAPLPRATLCPPRVSSSDAPLFIEGGAHRSLQTLTSSLVRVRVRERRER